MKMFLRFFKRNSSCVLVTFGDAKLTKLENGLIELHGGSHADQLAAKEWISIFMHEAVPKIR